MRGLLSFAADYLQNIPILEKAVLMVLGVISASLHHGAFTVLSATGVLASHFDSSIRERSFPKLLSTGKATAHLSKPPVALRLS